MKYVGTTMIFLRSLPERDAIREAAAHAYGVLIDAVSVGGYDQDDELYPPGFRVYLQLWADDYEGDFPVVFEQVIDASLAHDIDTVVQRMAEQLGSLVMTDDTDEENPVLHFPDGRMERRFLTTVPEGGKLLPDELKVA